MHISLDGFISGSNGEMDWIHVDEEIFDYVGNHTDTADAAIYGRVTFEMMDAYWPAAGDAPNASKHDVEHSRWYNTVMKYVLSKSMKSFEKSGTAVISENLKEDVIRIKQQHGKNILIFGSVAASQSLMKEDLIDEVWLLVNPVLLGKGVSYFPSVDHRKKMKLITTKVFNSGVIAMQYAFIHE